MALSAQKPRICYDLALKIAEKWLAFPSRNDDPDLLLKFDFLKILMINRQFKNTFLRIVEQNFYCSRLKAYDSKLSFRMCKSKNDANEFGPLFKDYENNCDAYGKIRSKWFYVFLLLNDVSLAVKEIGLYGNVLAVKEGHRNLFESRESSLVSALHLIFPAEKEYSMINYSSALATAGFQLRESACVSNSSGNLSCDTIKLFFNLNAKKVHLSLDVSSTLESSICADYGISAASEKVFLQIWSDKESDNSKLVCLDAAWKQILQYALRTCPALNSVELVFRFILFEDLSEGAHVVDKFLQWLRQEAIPLMVPASKFKLFMNQISVGNMNIGQHEFLVGQNFSVIGDNQRLHASSNDDPRFELSWVVTVLFEATTIIRNDD